MRDEKANARCSVCGAEGRRDDMFGAEPQLLCEKCADKVRTRTAPKATGRLVSTVVSGSVPVTIAVLAIAAVLFLLGRERTFPLLGMIKPTDDPRIIELAVLREPWRLLTSAFLHGGIFHILFNSYAMWFFSRVVEMRWGSPAVLAVIVCTAVGGGAAAWIFSWYAVGLSGALFGLAAFVFAQRKVDQFAGAVMNPYMTRQLVAWLVICIVLSELGSWRISNWGHGGGLAFGLILGYAWRLPHRWMWYVVVVLLTGGAMAAAVLNGRPGWAGG